MATHDEEKISLVQGKDNGYGAVKVRDYMPVCLA
jgi:hypothetical protein